MVANVYLRNVARRMISSSGRDNRSAGLMDRRNAFLTLAVAVSLGAVMEPATARQGSSLPSPVEVTSSEEWVGTWSASPQQVEPHNLPPAPGLAGNTFRQVVRVSLGGSRVRVRFSNVFGESPAALSAARLAVSLGDGAMDPASEREILFAGQPGVTIPAGGAVLSDPFSFALEPLSDLALTIRFGALSDEVITGHPGSRTTSYLAEGDAVSAPAIPDAVRTDHWYLIDRIDVARGEGAAVVVLGNSITDGRGSGTNRQNRWPDELARHLQADERTRHVAVLNAGIGGNCVLKACLGPSAVARFERDVLDQPGVRWVILFEGINDLGTAQPDSAARVGQALIAAYREMLSAARGRGILVYGATLLPLGGSFYDTPEREAARQAVNAWIRTSGAFDGVIDLEAALRDPADPRRLAPAFDTGDHLHPNELGHRMLAEAVEVGWFMPG